MFVTTAQATRLHETQKQNYIQKIMENGIGFNIKTFGKNFWNIISLKWEKSYT